MVDIQKIYLAVTPEEMLIATEAKNILDAEIVAIEEVEKSYRSGSGRKLQISFGVIGTLFIVITPIFPPSLLIGIGFLAIVFSSRPFQRKKLREKFSEFRSVLKSLDEHPELLSLKRSVINPDASILLSHAAKISGDEQLFGNTDKTKHRWDYAGYCQVDTGRRDGKSVVWQKYYIYTYLFQGQAPQIFFSHPKDPFVAPIEIGSPTIANSCLPWQCVIPEQYEIEALAILNPDTVEQLGVLGTSGAVCTLEIVNNFLFCFIPVENPNVADLLAHEKDANRFSQILLVQLEKSGMVQIGHISSTLAVTGDPDEEGEMANLTIQEALKEKRVQQKTLLVLVIAIMIFVGNALFEIVRSELLIMSLPFIIFAFMVGLMPKRIRRQWLKGSGIRINGRKKPKRER